MSASQKRACWSQGGKGIKSGTKVSGEWRRRHTDPLRGCPGACYLFGGLQKLEQVGHGGLVDLLFHAVGHERHAGALELVDVDSQDSVGGVVGPAEGDAGGGFSRDETGELATVLRQH